MAMQLFKINRLEKIGLSHRITQISVETKSKQGCGEKNYN